MASRMKSQVSLRLYSVLSTQRGDGKGDKGWVITVRTAQTAKTHGQRCFPLLFNGCTLAEYIPFFFFENFLFSFLT